MLTQSRAITPLLPDITDVLFDDLEQAVGAIEDYLSRDLWRIVVAYWLPTSRLRCPIDNERLADSAVIIKKGIAPVFYNRATLERSIAAGELAGMGITSNNMDKYVIDVTSITNRYWRALNNRSENFHHLLLDRQDSTNFAAEIQHGIGLSEALTDSTPLQIERIRTDPPSQLSLLDINELRLHWSMMPAYVSLVSVIESFAQSVLDSVFVPRHIRINRPSTLAMTGLNFIDQISIKAMTRYDVLDYLRNTLLSQPIDRQRSFLKWFMLSSWGILSFLSSSSLNVSMNITNRHPESDEFHRRIMLMMIGVLAGSIESIESMTYVDILLREREGTLRKTRDRSLLFTALTTGSLLAIANGDPNTSLLTMLRNPFSLKHSFILASTIPSAILSSQKINEVLINSGNDLLHHRHQFLQRTRHRYSTTKMSTVFAALLLGVTICLFTEDPLLALFVTINALRNLALLNRVQLATSPYILMPRPAPRLSTNDVGDEQEKTSSLRHDRPPNQ
jgi:hypothetical protein